MPPTCYFHILDDIFFIVLLTSSVSQSGWYVGGFLDIILINFFHSSFLSLCSTMVPLLLMRNTGVLYFLETFA